MYFSWLDFKLGFRMLGRYPGLTLVGGFAMAFAIWIGAGTFEVLEDITAPETPAGALSVPTLERVRIELARRTRRYRTALATLALATLAAVAILVSSLLGVITPFLTQRVFDDALFPADGSGVDLRLLLGVGGVLRPAGRVAGHVVAGQHPGEAAAKSRQIVAEDEAGQRVRAGGEGQRRLHEPGARVHVRQRG